MIKLGLIGYPLSHSFSAKYFKEKFEKENIKGYRYDAYPLENIQALPKLLEAEPELLGLNVTIPYKEAIIPYLDEMNVNAQKIGAVNVVKRVKGKLIGYNSDYVGFKNSLTALLKENDQEPIKALVLGSGGASKAVCAVLESLSIPFHVISRKNEGYKKLHAKEIKLHEHRLLINCTPLGTFPSELEKPDLPYQEITEKHFFHDLVYNPPTTSFMKEALERGAKAKNGYQMLVEQAEESWNIWTK